VATGRANAAGSATNFARRDHVHKTVVYGQEETNRNEDVTTVLDPATAIRSMRRLAPGRGKYQITFGARLTHTHAKAVTHVWIYVDGNEIRESKRSWSRAEWEDAFGNINTLCQAEVNEFIEVWWQTEGADGAARMYEKTLDVIQLS
jgi:hypothetical protein